MLGVGDAANIVSQCDSVNSGISQRAFLNSSHIAELVIERLCNGQFMNTPNAFGVIGATVGEGIYCQCHVTSPVVNFAYGNA